MRLRDMRLSTRITLGALLLVMAGGALWIGNLNQSLHQDYLDERTSDLGTALHIENERLVHTVSSLRQDVLFLAGLPPISGIMRASANQGFDVRDKNSYATWEARLQDIFAAFLRTHPDYSHARFIGLAGQGREIVRVDSRAGRVEVVAHGALQAKGDRDYFKAGRLLTAGSVYLSEFALEREWGKIVEPHRPVLHAVTPVFDAGGRLFGMVVLNLDAQPLLAASAAGLPAGVLSYISDQQEHFLFHPDARREFTFELGANEKISTDFPLLKALLADRQLNHLPLRKLSDGQDGYVAAEKVFFDAGDPARFLLLAYRIPAQVVDAQSPGIRLSNIVDIGLVMLLLGGLFMLLLRRAFAPLQRITANALEIAAGNYQLRIDRNAGGEIGELAAALNSMLDELSDHEQIKQEHAFRKSIIETVQEGYLLTDINGYLLEANQAYADISGYTLAELVGMHISQLEARVLSPDDVRARIAKIEKLGFDLFETSLRHKDGHLVDIEVSMSLMRETRCLVVFCRDISERKHAEEMMRVAAAAFETHDAIMIADANGNIMRVNQAFQDITGYGAEEVSGKNPRILSSGRQSKEFYQDMWQQLLGNGAWRGEIWDRRKSGQIYPKWLTITAVKDEAGKTTEYVAIFNDITERKQAEEEIRKLAFYDALTLLPNRRLLMDRLRVALSGSARGNYYGAVLFLDMDKFKVLNDTLGHDYGDLMLIEVAARLQACVREVDTVARLGGDEFVVLLEEVDGHPEGASQKAALVAEKIRSALSAPYQLKENVYHSSPSIGVCLYHGNGEPVEALLKHADMAMYQAKDSGRNAVCFFDPAMQLAVERRAALEADLRHAVSDRQLQLYYQIQVDRAHRPVGAEALVRWVHPTRGMVSPAQFIPVAEDSSLILDIGRWVLETACKQLGEWAMQESTRNLTLAVNVSAQQFKQSDFVENVAAALRAGKVEAARLKLELTEGVVLDDVTDVVAKMHALKALGVSLSMDDFGTGYSSLSYLKNLPLDQIKIDQSFVRDIATDPNDAVMVRAIIDMAKNFRLDVIAEGVETEAQLSFLKEHGCMAYQGYFFGKPVPIDEFAKLIG